MQFLIHQMWIITSKFVKPRLSFPVNIILYKIVQFGLLNPWIENLEINRSWVININAWGSHEGHEGMVGTRENWRVHVPSEGTATQFQPVAVQECEPSGSRTSVFMFSSRKKLIICTSILNSQFLKSLLRSHSALRLPVWALDFKLVSLYALEIVERGLNLLFE